jgi:hypothetical protein
MKSIYLENLRKTVIFETGKGAHGHQMANYRRAELKKSIRWSVCLPGWKGNFFRWRLDFSERIQSISFAINLWIVVR